jgi:predicted HTH domain antitoxin
MQITIELPNDMTQHANPGREALEMLAIEGYRSAALTHYQASRLLGMTRFEFDGFLKARNIYDHAYSTVDLDTGSGYATAIGGQGTHPSPMIVVVADTPLNYLVQIHCQDLSVLYERVFVPVAAFKELDHARTLAIVRS